MPLLVGLGMPELLGIIIFGLFCYLVIVRLIVRPFVRAFKQGLHGEEQVPYQRVVTPDSNLLRACPQCGHVTKAFHVACPICGAKLS